MKQNSQIDFLIGVLRARINRFYEEGAYIWSKADVQKDLSNRLETNNPMLLGALLRWEKSGYIKLGKDDEHFFEVLGPIPKEE